MKEGNRDDTLVFERNNFGFSGKEKSYSLKAYKPFLIEKTEAENKLNLF